ncbi:hypothetical protein ACJX0J_018975, partial [Zea mays]
EIEEIGLLSFLNLFDTATPDFQRLRKKKSKTTRQGHSTILLPLLARFLAYVPYWIVNLNLQILLVEHTAISVRRLAYQQVHGFVA